MTLQAARATRSPDKFSTSPMEKMFTTKQASTTEVKTLPLRNFSLLSKVTLKQQEAKF
jgi:hypothetical protein